MKRLATYVHVVDAEGTNHVLGPDDEVPAELAKLITNPKAWESDAPEESEPTPARTGRRRSTS